MSGKKEKNRLRRRRSLERKKKRLLAGKPLREHEFGTVVRALGSIGLDCRWVDDDYKQSLGVWKVFDRMNRECHADGLSRNAITDPNDLLRIRGFYAYDRSIFISNPFFGNSGEEIEIRLAVAGS